MSCIVKPATPFTEEQEQRLSAARPKSIPPQQANSLLIPLVCLPKYSTNGWLVVVIPPPPPSQMLLFFTATDPSGNPVPNEQITIGNQTLLTNSSGVAGPFVIVNNSQPVTLTLTVTDTSGNPVPNLTITLGGVSKVTNSNGQVIFNISQTGVVS